MSREIHNSSDIQVPIVNLTSSDCEGVEGSQLLNERRKLKTHFTDLLTTFNQNSTPRMFQNVEEVNTVSSGSDSNDLNVVSIRDSTTSSSQAFLAPSTSVGFTPTDRQRPDEPQNHDERHFTNFFKWLETTVILDDLSFRQPFINSAIHANDLTEQNMLLHGVSLYKNLEQLNSYGIMNLPFIPRPMNYGETMMDIPFLDPLLVVLSDIHIDDLHWMLNVLPWRVVDRPIRRGRSILAWIFEIVNIPGWLEATRAPQSVTVKIIRFFDHFFES